MTEVPDKPKTLEEFYSDIAQPTGAPTGFRSVRAERRQDPVLTLRRPLAFYEDRVFFYAGLLYGFCRLDSSATERFREATGSSVRTENYLVQHPLFTVRGFPGFSQTKVAHLLSAVEQGPMQQPLFDWLASQLIVDRKRGICWRVRMVTIGLPDPFMVDAQEPNIEVSQIVVFVPYRPTVAYAPLEQQGGRATPEVLAFPEDNKAFATEEMEVIRGKG